MEKTDCVELIAETSEGGLRLDKFLAQRLSELSRSRLQGLIKVGRVSVQGSVMSDPNARVVAGDRVAVTLPPPVAPEPVAQDMPLNIVFEDAHLIVVDKPAGRVVHPSAGHEEGTLVNALIAHCGDSLSGIGGVKRPGIVHRIDKETSGLLVVAKTDVAHQGLSEQFAAHGRDGRLRRVYIGLVWGVPPRRKGVIDVPLGRSSANRKKVSVVGPGKGRQAVTHYEVMRSFGGGADCAIATQIQFQLETGRTHQIRVHMAHLGHPLLGDKTYGGGFKSRKNKLPQPAQNALAALDRQALHASQLGFVHPVSGEKLIFESILPSDMTRLVEALTEMDQDS